MEGERTAIEVSRRTGHEPAGGFLRFGGGGMKVRATLLPGQKGTRELVKRYGDQLVCVRYRYDAARQKRLKTVELIIDEQDWVPGIIFPTTGRVLLRVGYGETELREAVKAQGGFWDPEKKAWVLAWRKVMEMGLEQRIIGRQEGF